MSRTIRNGWNSRGSKTDLGHKGSNDWFSKKNTCYTSTSCGFGEYWGRDKAGVKATTRRIRRRHENMIDQYI